MADVVRGKACILYLKLGSVYYPVACTRDVSMTIDRDMIELAPRASSDAREYEYGRYTGEITGSGLTKINTSPDNLYTIFDIVGYQLSKVKALAKFSLEDPQGNLKVFECNTLVKTTGFTKTSGQILGHSYTLQITGPVTVSSTPVANTNPQILDYEYTATGSTSTLTMTWGADATIIVLYVNGVQKQVIDYPGSYTASQVQYNASTKVITFGTALSASDYVKIIYIDVDAVATLGLEDGSGNFIEDGSGNIIDTA